MGGLARIELKLSRLLVEMAGDSLSKSPSQGEL